MNKKLLSTILAALMLLFVACDSNDDDNNPVGPDESYDFTSIINSYVNKTIIPTYAQFKGAATEMEANIDKLIASKTQANVDAACKSWKDARIGWEASEAFLFGPAADFNIDPSLDSWPLDFGELNKVINSNEEITKDMLLENKGPAIRGFHTAEYLLFRDGAPRKVADITERELQYLKVTTGIIKDDVESLYKSWTTSYNVEFINAGKAGSRFASQEAAIDQLINGVITIADEVGTGKLVDPFEAKNPLLVESWYSWNSLTDFQYNIRGIENAYMGGFDKSDRGTGLDKFIEAKNPTLNARVKAEITDAINKIGAIPAPFRSNLDKDTEINAAINACLKVRDTFQKDILPLVVK